MGGVSNMAVVYCGVTWTLRYLRTLFFANQVRERQNECVDRLPKLQGDRTASVRKSGDFGPLYTNLLKIGLNR